MKNLNLPDKPEAPMGVVSSDLVERSRYAAGEKSGGGAAHGLASWGLLSVGFFRLSWTAGRH